MKRLICYLVRHRWAWHPRKGHQPSGVYCARCGTAYRL